MRRPTHRSAEELRPSRRGRVAPTPTPAPRRTARPRLTSEELRPSRRRVAARASAAAGTGARVASAAGRAAVRAGWDEARRPKGGHAAHPGAVGHPGPRRSIEHRPGPAAPGAAGRLGPGPASLGRLGAGPGGTLLRSPAERRQRRIERAARIPDIDTSGSTRTRLRLLLVVCILAAVGIVAQLVDLHVRRGPALAERVRKQLVRTDRLPAERGSIFDRAGRDLAISVQVPTIAADPRLIADPIGHAQILSGLVGVDAGVLRERLSRPGGKFAYVARQVDEQTAKRVEEAKLPGVFTLLEPKRFLPAEALARPVLGRVNAEGDGLSGLEYQYRDILAGTPGKLVSERDQQGREIPGGRIELDPSARGDDLVLTIDRSLQNETEQRLSDQITATSAKGGIALVMDSGSGELLSVANLVAEVLPLGSPADQVPKVLPSDRNQALTDVYEPGSVNKLITIAGAIEDGKVRPDEMLTVPTQIQVGDHLYTEAEPHPTASWSVTDIVANSSNVGTIMIGQKLGKERFDSYLRAFGFGSRTGLGDPGESPGILMDPARYTATSMGSFPIGQGIAVTAVQMLAAYNAAANGGTYVAPRLVKATVGPDGRQQPTPVPEPRRVVSPQTAAEMTKMLTEVVRVGTGTLAAVDGYTVAGKTGTARKPLVGERGYEEGAYISSFAGFVPAEKPRLTAMVILDQPTPIYGGLVAAPVFADLARYALRELQVPPPVGGLPPTSARDADVESAQGVGDLGDARAPATLPAPARSRAAAATTTAAPSGGSPPSTAAPTMANASSVRSTTSTARAGSASRAGPSGGTMSPSTTGTVSRRPVTTVARR